MLPLRGRRRRPGRGRDAERRDRRGPRPRAVRGRLRRRRGRVGARRRQRARGGVRGGPGARVEEPPAEPEAGRAEAGRPKRPEPWPRQSPEAAPEPEAHASPRPRPSPSRLPRPRRSPRPRGRGRAGRRGGAAAPDEQPPDRPTTSPPSEWRARRPRSVRRSDRRHRRRQVGGARPRSSGSAPRRSRPTRSCTSCCGTDEVRDTLVERLGDDVAPGRRGRPRAPWPRRVFGDDEPARVARGAALAPRRASAMAEWREELERATRAAGGGGRGAAAVRGRVWRRPSTPRSPSWPTRTSATSAPARAGTRRGVERTSRQLSQEEKAAACGLRGPQRWDARGAGEEAVQSP